MEVDVRNVATSRSNGPKLGALLGYRTRFDSFLDKCLSLPNGSDEMFKQGGLYGVLDLTFITTTQMHTTSSKCIPDPF